MALLNMSAVQTRLGQWAADRISQNIGAKVTLETLDIDFFNKLSLRGFLVFDQQNDTLIAAKEIRLSATSLLFRENKFEFGELLIADAAFHLQIIDSSGTTNFDFIADAFAPKTAENELPDSADVSNLLLKADALNLANFEFTYTNAYTERSSHALDFNNLHINDLNARLSKFQLDSDSIVAEIEEMRFREESGFRLAGLKGAVTIKDNGISIDHFKLNTPASEIAGTLASQHDDWSDYSDFVNSVKIKAELDPSTINLSDFGYLFSGLEQADVPIALEGKINGAISNLKGRGIKIAAGSQSILRGNFDITGLPDAENAFLDIRVSQFSTDYDDMQRIRNGISSKASDFVLPVEFERLGGVYFDGSFTGFPQDFVAFGSLITSAGNLGVDLNVKNDSLNDRLVYTGSLNAQSFDLGRILAIPKLGTASAEVDILAYSKDEFESAEVTGRLSQLNYAGYTYKNIQVDGDFSQRTFEGNLQSRDPNVNFDFQGIVDLSSAEPVFDFDADIFNIDLTALNLIELEQTLSVSSRLYLNARGSDVNDVMGSLTARDSYVCFGDSVIFIENLKFTAAGGTSNRVVGLTSDILDISVTGAFDMQELGQSFENLIGEVMPSAIDVEPVKKEQLFDFSVNYKQSNSLSGLLIPGIEIAAQTTAYGSYNSRDRSFSLFLRSGHLAYLDYVLNDVTVDLGKISEILKGKLYASSAAVKEVQLENLDIDVEAYNDIAQVGLGWYNYSGDFQADLGAEMTFISRKKTNFKLFPGYFGSDGSLWEITDTANVRMDSTHYQTPGLKIKNRNQVFYLEGAVSENPDELLNISLEDFNFASFDSLGLGVASGLSGNANIQASLSDFYEERVLRVDLQIDSIGYSGYYLGDVGLTSRYYGDENTLAINGSLNRDNTKIIDLEGEYLLGVENPLMAKLTLDDFDLGILNAFNIPEINNYSGRANGEISVSGEVTEPALDGFIDFDRARFKVEYLNTYYTFSDRVRVEDGWFGIDYKPLYDEQGHEGFVVASAFHTDYAKWTYDVSVEVDNFFLLNTTRAMNSTYYGTAYGTGSVQIGGYDGFTEISVDAKTTKGTAVKLPLDESEEVTMENFVHFVSNADTVAVEREVDLSGIQLRLNIDATPDAEVQLIFDEDAGDIIRGRGAGRITFEISPSGEFLMFGRYEIDEGSYLFTLQNLINKQFKLRKGGVIGWYGDPYQADISLSASYNVRTPLYPIISENPDRYRGREDVGVVLNLDGKLLNPDYFFCRRAATGH